MSKPEPEVMGTPMYLEDFCKKHFPKKEEEPLTIIEVGTWKGASAFKMISACNKNCKVYCVDTWLGSMEHYDSIQRDSNGYPNIFGDFWTNVKRAGYEDIVVPVTLPSTMAAEYLQKKGIRADVIYIDAAHDYKNTKSDLDAFWPLLKKESGSLFFGDDFHDTWFGVIGAVQRFGFELGIKPSVVNKTWFFKV